MPRSDHTGAISNAKAGKRGTCAGEKAGQEPELSRARLFTPLSKDRSRDLLSRCPTPRAAFPENYFTLSTASFCLKMNK